MLFWLLACADPDPGEARLYAEALSSELTLEEALSRCAQLDEPGSCQLDVLSQRDKTGPNTCPDVAPGTWQDECWFMSSENPSLSRDVRRSRCAEAGRFRPWCYMHAWGAELEQASFAADTPLALHEAVLEIEQGWQATASENDPEFSRRIHEDAWFRWQSRSSTVDTRICVDLPASSRCEVGSLVAIHRLLEISTRKERPRMQEVCRAGVVSPSLRLVADGPRVGSDPKVLAETERLLKLWCIHGKLPTGNWWPQFVGLP